MKDVLKSCQLSNLFSSFHARARSKEVEKMKLGIVIPTRNEAENLRYTLPGIRHLYPNALIFLIDDMSDDGTIEIGREHGAIIPYTFKKRGLGRSYREGLAMAYYKYGCNVVIHLDADHPVEALPSFVKKLSKEEYDVAVGVDVKGKRLSRKVAVFLGRRFLGLKKFRHVTCGYMGYTKEFLEALNLRRIKSKGDGFHLEMLYEANRLGVKIAEVPFRGKRGRETRFLKIFDVSPKRVFSWLWTFTRLFVRRHTIDALKVLEKKALGEKVETIEMV